MRLAGQRENNAFVRRHRVQQTSSVLSARYVIILRTRRLAALHRNAYRLPTHRTALVSLRVEHRSNLARLHGIDVLKEKARIPRHTRDVHPDSVHTQLHTASFSPTQATHHRRKPCSAALAMRIREKRSYVALPGRRRRNREAVAAGVNEDFAGLTAEKRVAFVLR